MSPIKSWQFWDLFLPWNFIYAALVTIVVLLLSTCSALNDANDLVVTKTELEALTTFKAEVVDLLPENFMRTDFYLIRWLRNANMDIFAAKSALLKTVEWRKQNNMTNILKEDWSDMEQEYPTSFGKHDLEGRPVSEMNFGNWDIRAAALQGKMPRLLRYMKYMNENNMQLILDEQTKGKQVTRFVSLVDADGLNLRQHLCPSCMSALIQWTVGYEANYPMFCDEVIVINAPGIASFAMQSLRPVMSPSLRNQIKIFNSNKNEWQPYINKKIDRSQRSTRYGGTGNW